MSRATWFLVVIVLGSAAIAAFALWPVCVPLTAEQVASSQAPLAERTEKDLYLRVFQRRDGQWHQCKTRLSRMLFF